jgi:hypothetical protein
MCGHAYNGNRCQSALSFSRALRKKPLVLCQLSNEG